MAADTTRTVRFGRTVVTRGPLRHSSSNLFVPFTIEGPAASDWAPENYVVIVRDGDDEKLQWVGGTGGVEGDGSRFYVWRLSWSGGHKVRIRYFADRDLLDDELVSLGEPDPEAAWAVLQDREFVLVDPDWFGTDDRPDKDDLSEHG